MKNNIEISEDQFTLKKLFIAILQSYVFPAVMSFTSGWFLNDINLQKASVTTIAIPSALATFFSFVLLWKLYNHQVILVNKITQLFLFILLMCSSAALIIWSFQLQAEFINILLSVVIGTAITTWNYSFTPNREIYE